MSSFWLARRRNLESLPGQPEPRISGTTLIRGEQKLASPPEIVCLDTPWVNVTTAAPLKAFQPSEHPLPLSRAPSMGSWNPVHPGLQIFQLATATELLALHLSPRLPASSHLCHQLSRTRNSACNCVSRVPCHAAWGVFLELQQPCLPTLACCCVQPSASSLSLRKVKQVLPVGMALWSRGAVQGLNVRLCPNSGVQVCDSSL